MNKLKDYVVYIDTDSLYIQLYDWFIDNNVNIEKWNKLSMDDKISYIKRISNEVEKYVNDCSIEETQIKHYNSQIKKFGIVFEQEKIALTGLFKSKKKYAMWTLINEGEWKNDVSITGLEVIRSDSPEIVKPMVKKVLEMILLEKSDSEIRDHISECKEKLKLCSPSEIAENKGINKLEKYDFTDTETAEMFEAKSIKTCIKGSPHQIKGALNFKFIVEKMKIDSKYEAPMSGNKSKVVYLNKNKFKMDSLSFIDWPEEFNKAGITINYNKMIENNFTKKVKSLLSIVNKVELNECNSVILDLFE